MKVVASLAVRTDVICVFGLAGVDVQLKELNLLEWIRSFCVHVGELDSTSSSVSDVFEQQASFARVEFSIEFVSQYDLVREADDAV